MPRGPPAPRIAETINFPAEELKILSLWKELDIFNECQKQSKNKPIYSFYDGPPFATGLPHYGHILTSTVKDIMTRYAFQRGFHVERRFGWDCHGLPVEYEIDKALEIKGSEDVEKMGVDKYNGECRKIVSRYVEEWKSVMGRMGRWVDFDNDYKTLYPWYMESVWWVFQQLYLKGFVYHGNKIMPYSTACHTPLSNFESGQNYKEVIDPAITVSLPIIEDEQGAAMLIWTTTPWTLPSNLAACVNSKLVYARCKETSTGQVYVLLRSRASFVFKEGDYEVLEEFLGEQLKGLKYEPIFPYYAEMSSKGAFTVLTDDYVSSDSGTGIVHQAPYFGEDDFRVCLAAGIVTSEQEPICPIDADGRLTKPVVDFEGQYFKDADKNIIAALKAKKRLIRNSQIKHTYPFCWRSDTPLIYKAIPSWFIRVQHMAELLRETSSKTYWVPEFVREKRFGNWLRGAKDWAISRNRYWGTPIPIWSSPSGDEIHCVGSIAELERLTGTKINDLHCENIDHLLIPSRGHRKPPLRRIPEVFDCWFESGSMPYAQKHFPFENLKEFHDSFPADFIAEGIDQTRGWFYTLLVVSTALFGSAPFKNLISIGLILASDGQKMSKSKKNYPDPMEIVAKYGADALRLYLINSPVVRAENLRFKEEGVHDIIKHVFLPWFNTFRFLMQNIEAYMEVYNKSFVYKEYNVRCVMDKWILSFTQSLLEYVHEEMDLYHLYNVVPRLIRYFEHLTNWYVRINRKRLRGETIQYAIGTDWRDAIMSLFGVLLHITKMMAPLVPFFSEYVYQYLKPYTNLEAKSIHLLMLPDPKYSLIDKNIERAVSRLQDVVELGRILRDRHSVPMKYPLSEVIIFHEQLEFLNDLMSVEDCIISEINVRKVTMTNSRQEFGIQLKAKPNHKALGMYFRKDYTHIAIAIESLTDSEVSKLTANGFVDKGDVRIEIPWVKFNFKVDAECASNFGMEMHKGILLMLDVNQTQSSLYYGAAREIVNRIQKLRKKAHLVPSDKIDVYYQATKELKIVTSDFKNSITDGIRTKFLPIESKLSTDELIIEETMEFKLFKNSTLHVLLTKKPPEPKNKK